MATIVLRKVSIACIAALLGMAIMTLSAQQANAAELEATGLAPGKTDLTSPDTSDIACILANITSGAGSVTWDSSTNTITMTNATIDLDADSNKNTPYAVMISGKDAEKTPTVTLKLVGKNTVKGTSSSIWASVYAESANLVIAGTGSLNVTLPNTRTDTALYVDGTLTAQSGAVNVTKGSYAFYSTGKLTLAGASLSATQVTIAGLRARGPIELSKGSLTVKNSKQYGVCTEKNITLKGANVSISQTKSEAIFTSSGTIEITAGKTSIDSCRDGFQAAKSVKVAGSKASVSVKGATNAGLFGKSVSLAAGSVSVSKSSIGIYSESGITMTGGAVKVSGATSVAVQANGGKLKISGGSVSAQCAKTSLFALYAGKTISNKASALKKVKGVLGAGATFKVASNTYVANDGILATLKSYGSKTKTPVVNSVKFGGVSYQVRTIGANAFNTKAGKAITKLTIGKNVQAIGAKALYNTGNLTSLITTRSSGYKWKLSGNAFTKCGKKSGKSLVVTCKYSYDAPKMKRIFTKAGMSSKATFK